MAVVLALVASACGGDDSGDDASPATTAEGPESTDDATDDDATDDTGDEQADDTTPDDTDAAALPDGYQGYESTQYAGGDNWLCHPERAEPPADDENICHRDLDATLISADGTVTPQPHQRAEDPAIDCFYVYPTVSRDPEPNSDLVPAEDEEIWATLNQAARLSSVCEVYAPVYRSRTVTALLQGNTDDEVREIAYGDVLDAWKHYVANHNDGRGVLLVGHSQGSTVLTRLVEEEIDDEPLLRDRLVAAYLLGSAVAVPTDGDVGGSFSEIPLCRAADQTGCVISYASFSTAEPPPDDSFFGRLMDDEDSMAACTNPAALDGGSGELVAYFDTGDTADSLTDGALAGLPEGTVDTPWVALAGGLEAECAVAEPFSYLEVTVANDDDGARSEALRGGLPPNWGLHLADANLAMGNLLELAATQAAAHTAAN